MHILAPDAESAAALQTRLKTLPTVGAVTIPDDFVPRAQDAKAAKLAQVQDLLIDLDAPSGTPVDLELATLAVEYLRETALELSGDSRIEAERVVRSAEAMLQQQSTSQPMKLNWSNNCPIVS